MGTVRDNLARVRERMVAAAVRVGRDPASVSLVAISKGIELDRIEEGLDAGVAILGENRVQEARDKWDLVRDREVGFHLVGHLQRNKAGPAVEMFDLIHSLDSARLASALQGQAERRGRTVPVLIEVNTSGEATKHGIHPDDLEPLLEALRGCPNLSVRGLMTIGPLGGGEQGARRSFTTLRMLLPMIGRLELPGAVGEHLSMGMSNDFEVAIEEGATLVRVGSAIFGARNR